MSKKKRKYTRRPKQEQATIENEPPVDALDEPIESDGVIADDEIEDEPEINETPKADEPMTCPYAGCNAVVIVKGGKYQCQGKRRHTWVK